MMPSLEIILEEAFHSEIDVVHLLTCDSVPSNVTEY